MTRNPLLYVGILMAAGLSLTACDSGPTSRTIGYVEADWHYIAAPGSGWIVDLGVAEGDRVAVGDLLFSLDTEAETASRAEANARAVQAVAESANISTGARQEELQALRARLAEAQARLTRADADFVRIMPLVEEGLEARGRGDALIAERNGARASVEALRKDIRVAELAERPEALQAAEAATQGAKAALARADYQLEQRTTRARTDGRVETILLDRGEYATPGAPVLALLPDDALKVRFFVPQARLPEIALGGEVSVASDGSDHAVDAVISYIATEAEFTPPVIYSRNERQKFVFLVEATLPSDTALRPGLPVDVDW
ncbi:MAG: HlyD family efflux transporter periplasmic adaptor subunit [Pseudomonadota bacterium]